MTTLSAAQQAAIKDVVAKVLEVPVEHVGSESDFVGDLGADSMKLIELLSYLEVEFEVDIDVDRLDEMVNLDGVHAVLDEVLRQP